MWKTLILCYLRRIKGLDSPASIIGFAASRYAERIFMIEPETNRQVSFREFAQKVESLAKILSEKGLKRGETLAFSGANCIEYFKTRAACHLNGFVFFALPAHLDKETVEYFVKKSGAKILVKPDDVKSGIASVPVINHEAPRNDEGISTFNMSSGTTGKIPKIVQLTESNWVESLYGYIRNSDTSPRQKITFLCCLPYATAGSTTFLPSLLAGVTYMVVKENPQPEVLVDYINKYAVNRLYLTPSALIGLTEWCKNHDQRLSSLESIITGTERMPAPLLKEAIEYFGPIISVGYGMVEALPPVTMFSPKKDINQSGVGCGVLGVGRVLRGVRVKITEEGKIAIQSKTVSAGYLDNPEETARGFKDGWFYSNDYGYIDKGYLYVLGRQEEIVGKAKTGALIFAAEIEARLYELDFIKRCAVLTKDNRIVVFAALRGETNSEEAETKILEFAKSNFKELPIPDKIIVKDSLPVNALGKLDRKGLEGELEREWS